MENKKPREKENKGSIQNKRKSSKEKQRRLLVILSSLRGQTNTQTNKRTNKEKQMMRVKKKDTDDGLPSEGRLGLSMG